MIRHRQFPKPISLLLVSGLVAWTLPAFADNLAHTKDTAVQQSTASNITNNSDIRTRCSQTLGVAKGSCGILFAVTCGIPIKTCKYIYSESHRMVKTLHDDFTDERDISATVLASTFGIPYGVASGTVLGIVHGVEDGIKDGYNEPFSKKSVGL